MKKNKKSFIEFFQEYIKYNKKNKYREHLLEESPEYAGLYNCYLNSEDAARLRLAHIKKFDKPIQKYKGFDVYFGDSMTKGGNDYSFVYNDKLMATFSIRSLDNNGMEMLSVWNEPYDGKGLARQLIFNYFFPDYTYILCGESHTEQGKQFWVKIITIALEQNIKCSIVDTKNKTEIPINNMDELKENQKEIWGNGKHEIRLKILK